MRTRGFLDVVGSRRMAVTVLAAITGLYYLIVAITNITDTDTNRRGVTAVLGMRQTLHHPSVDWHAITNGTVVWVVYILIVIWELLIALVLLSAAVAWVRTLTGRPAQALATKLSSLGWIMAIVLFLGGFLTIGGEWFRMWANKEVNASAAALQNFLIASVGLILLNLPDRDLPPQG
ncbi:DUF2165 domain-containing protein [Nocardia sp. CDC159]|uniref:DUF2165 domain-containing protein n=1 Tax=Nocardia pulmonis TaxID=2951408 RepID=A0A9X2IVC1_9NOCA|nr:MULTISPECIES: DUF2165 domain-containing protein [Nocardia]MCM6772284.1 DUF2165 domain-containing protein [Nocardia pulmonis]MCM6785058.1 DUF2165 domain-containing protein [Nocardia sp. CDC159]